MTGFRKNSVPRPSAGAKNPVLRPPAVRIPVTRRDYAKPAQVAENPTMDAAKGARPGPSLFSDGEM